MYGGGVYRVSKASELLENLKGEIESLTHEISVYKHQKDDYERKFQNQLAELNTIQQTLYDLERQQTKMKLHYEEEIRNLKRQLDQQNNGNLNNRDLSSPSTFNRSNSPAPTPQHMQRNTPTPTNPDKGQPNKQGRNRSNSGEFYPSGGTSFPTLNPLDQGRGHPQNMPKENIASMGNNIKKDEDAKEEERRRQEREMEIDENGKEKGQDWLVGYNPSVQTNLNIDLLHNLQHNSVVCCVNFSNDGKYLATGCNRSAQIYDVDSGKKIHSFVDESDKDGDLYIRSVCFSPDGNYLATGAEDKTVKVWDIHSKKIQHTFYGHELDIYSLDYSSDGRFIVSGSGDKKAKIWDIEKGKCAYTLGNEEVGPKNGVTSVAMSPDGRLVAAGSLDNIVRLWDAQTGYFLERYEGHLDSVYSVAFSPDGKSLASGSLDKSLKLWDLSGSRSRSRCRATFNGHKDFVLSVAFSPDGNWLISGSKDRSVQFWDPRNGTTHMMLQGHKNSVISVALSPKLSSYGVFATGSGDFRARLWKYDS
ncbi:hypothetical protein DICPUDRAFT_77529 [Dictyostelium purpureum]|uniref:Transcriptional repressor Tup1 N-terminal domain-containing protein n=1 Tax=Dictyostelium purpureum TaxID=5786 RepID=F0ZGW0_DICPU|nr:uncharacterized protein DICPUDRAFT_77529 [Dictyostelium purpureum]EGC36846.1 hypothetical protein DICPUDRAFT_77529 [Dictyostelium purpureum]|eukprot:XP_003286644.1 hypothetical protein DICPUDRAFT_77529 [Dictyostelium purpureum]